MALNALVDQECDILWTWKIVFVGNSDVGKTRLLQTYMNPNPHGDTIITTPYNKPKSICGQEDKIVDFSGGRHIKLSIMDTAGMEKYRSLVKSYFRGAEGIILMYDVTDRKSFEDCTEWLNIMTSTVEENVVVILVGNKTDLVESSPSCSPSLFDATPTTTTTTTANNKSSVQRRVTIQEALSFAMSNHLSYIETSAVNGRNVEDVFRIMLDQISIRYKGLLDLDEQELSSSTKREKKKHDKINKHHRKSSSPSPMLWSMSSSASSIGSYTESPDFYKCKNHNNINKNKNKKETTGDDRFYTVPLHEEKTSRLKGVVLLHKEENEEEKKCAAVAASNESACTCATL